MVNKKNRIAKYRIIADSGGSRYRFFCEASGACVHMTKPIKGETQEAELMLAWEEARPYFNKCPKCGRYVWDTMYNADVCECVDCTPWENEPDSRTKYETDESKMLKKENMRHFGFGIEVMKETKVCIKCGNPSPGNEFFCRECGYRLPEKSLYDIYEEGNL